MKIKKRYQNCNDQTCVRRTLQIPLTEVKTQKNKYGSPEITKEEDEKYFKIIKDSINFDEETLEFEYSRVWCEYALFEITTREKWRINIENKIKEKIGMKPDDELDLNEDNWVHTWGGLNKERLANLKSKLPITDWEAYGDRDYGSVTMLKIDLNKLQKETEE